MTNFLCLICGRPLDNPHLGGPLNNTHEHCQPYYQEPLQPFHSHVAGQQYQHTYDNQQYEPSHYHEAYSNAAPFIMVNQNTGKLHTDEKVNTPTFHSLELADKYSCLNNLRRATEIPIFDAAQLITIKPIENDKKTRIPCQIEAVRQAVRRAQKSGRFIDNKGQRFFALHHTDFSTQWPNCSRNTILTAICHTLLKR